MSEIPTTDLDSAHQALDHMLVSVREHAWPNVRSVTVGAAEVELAVLVDELSRIEGLVVGIIEGVRADVERLQMLFQLLSFSMISTHISCGNVDLTASQIWSI